MQVLVLRSQRSPTAQLRAPQSQSLPGGRSAHWHWLMLQSKPAAPQSPAVTHSTQARVEGLHTSPVPHPASDGSQAPHAPDIAPLSAHC